MATKKNAVEEQAAQAEEQAAAAGAGTAETAGSTESPAAGAPEEERHDEQAAESAETAAPDPEKDAAPAQEASELLSLSALAARHRVASWQQAALCRYMGWADGKMLTDAEYGTALKQLAARHMGGGRRR